MMNTDTLDASDFDTDENPETAAGGEYYEVTLAPSANPRWLPLVVVRGQTRRSVPLVRGVRLTVDREYLEAVQKDWSWPGHVEPYVTIKGPFPDSRISLNGHEYPDDLRRVTSPEKWVAECRSIETLKAWLPKAPSGHVGAMISSRLKMLIHGVEASVDPYIWGRSIGTETPQSNPLQREQPEKTGRGEDTIFHRAPRDHDGRPMVAPR
jgi:hypothetical protein